MVVVVFCLVSVAFSFVVRRVGGGGGDQSEGISGGDSASVAVVVAVLTSVGVNSNVFE